MSRRLHLLLEVEDTEPVNGSLHLEDGTTRPFSGWLGLMAAIREAASRHPPRSPVEPSQPTDETMPDA
jgi:hypothetical protein